MGITVSTSPPRVVVDYGDLQPGATDFNRVNRNYQVSSSAANTWGHQIRQNFKVDYRVDNGATTIASGSWNIVDATAQGDFTSFFSGFTDSQTQSNFLGATPQPSSSNLFDPPTATTTSTTTDLTLSGAYHNFLSPHSFSFVETKLATMTALIREANLQALVDSYPSGTITFTVSVHDSQNYDFDIHGDFVITSILSTSTFVTPAATFPLSDFGVDPSTPPDEEECPCDWSAISPVPGGIWNLQTGSCAEFTLAALPTTTWTKRGCP